MQILDAAHVHGTFFVVGQALVRAAADRARARIATGTSSANHSYHHDEWRWLDPRYPELERAQVAFQREIGTCPAWFRPPNGERTPFMARVVRQHGMRMAMWDVSATATGTTNDRATIVAPGAARRARAARSSTCATASTARRPPTGQQLVGALPAILDGLRAMHLEPVRLDELVGGPAYTVV